MMSYGLNNVGKLFVAVDIGCIECGEQSSVLGVFDNEEAAELVRDKAQKKQSKEWKGQHDFQVFEVPGLNQC